jgi:hypothetical protein
MDVRANVGGEWGRVVSNEFLYGLLVPGRPGRSQYVLQEGLGEWIHDMTPKVRWRGKVGGGRDMIFNVA